VRCVKAYDTQPFSARARNDCPKICHHGNRPEPAPVGAAEGHWRSDRCPSAQGRRQQRAPAIQGVFAMPLYTTGGAGILTPEEVGTLVVRPLIEQSVAAPISTVVQPEVTILECRSSARTRPPRGRLRVPKSRRLTRPSPKSPSPQETGRVDRRQQRASQRFKPCGACRCRRRLGERFAAQDRRRLLRRRHPQPTVPLVSARSPGCPPSTREPTSQTWTGRRKRPALWRSRTPH
jgi:hypothetical protein